MLSASRSGPLFAGLALSLGLGLCACSSIAGDGGGSGGSDSGTGTGGDVLGGTGGATGAGGTGTGGASGADQTSAQLLASLSLGFNIGNSLDVPDSETAWGNPAISAAFVQAVADAGFDLVRIPVTWSKHTGPGPAFTIEPAYLERVEEVVGYVEAAGLHAIINVHHDGADAFDGAIVAGGVEWLSLNDSAGAVTDANNTAVRERFVAVWTQIATHFADHGESLLFESMNEIHDGYGAPVTAYYDIINNLNQTFVDTVRGQGGNNLTRHLVVPGYNTNVDYTVAGFVKPTDPTADHLILSIHYYDPWSYAGAATTHTWGAASPGTDSWGQESYVTDQLDKLKTQFIDAGLPMIVGEYGAVQQDGYDDYRRYYMEYFTKAAHDRGLVPVYWDNGGSGSGADNFGLFNRTTGAVTQATLLAAMKHAAQDTYTLAEVPLPTP